MQQAVILSQAAVKNDFQGVLKFFGRSMNKPFASISIIIPVAPEDDSWVQLVEDLCGLRIGREIVIAGPKPPMRKLGGSKNMASDSEIRRFAWARTAQGRAKQMNQAIKHASGTYLWFLHADSRVSSACAHHLALAIERKPEALHFFDLKFHDTINPLLKINELGVRLRSHFLNMPFGDQGFCISRALFDQVGGFDETAAYGEDHLFVWNCVRKGINLHGVDAALGTSARKYSNNGWLKTTIMHQYLTYKQALPEFLKTYGPFAP